MIIPNRNMVGPKYGVRDGMPLRLISVGRFEEGLSDVKMTALYYSVSAGVVTRYANVINMVALADIFECF